VAHHARTLMATPGKMNPGKVSTISSACSSRARALREESCGGASSRNGGTAGRRHRCSLVRLAYVPRVATLSGLSSPKPVATALHRACVRARCAPLGERCSADAAPSGRARGHVPPSSAFLVKEVPAATFREFHPHTQDLGRERRR
jgi:hypothetical protein